jgi:hypothetical protein
MSYNLEGKLANQKVYASSDDRLYCERCTIKIEKPFKVTINNKETGQLFFCKSYIGTEHFIYETKKGRAVVYCSEYCRDLHNHRFSK